MRTCQGHSHPALPCSHSVLYKGTHLLEALIPFPPSLSLTRRPASATKPPFPFLQPPSKCHAGRQRWGVGGRRRAGYWGWMGIEGEMHTSDTRRISLSREITLSDWCRGTPAREKAAGGGGADRNWGGNVLITVCIHIMTTT